MPYYDYYCSDCGIEWAANVRSADRHSPPKETHPGNCLPNIKKSTGVLTFFSTLKAKYR